MIKLVKGDLFLSRAQVLAHGCNCAGKMGAGIAREFKRRCSAMCKEYKRRCHSGEFRPGGYYLYKKATPWVLNLVTQTDMGGARIEYVRKCFQRIADNYEREGITSIAMPRIAAGLGGLEWRDVTGLALDKLDPLSIPILIYSEYEPGDKASIRKNCRNSKC